MKAKHLTAMVTTLAAGTALSSCVLQTDPVPEIPYRPRPVVITAAPQQEEAPQTTTWETAPAASSHITESPADRTPVGTAVEPKVEPAAPVTSKAEPVAPVTPTPAAAASSPLEITPFTPTTAAPAAPSSPAAAAAAASSAADLSKITNDGPIPTAARVEGDPTRVWNPLDPSKKIRIINPKTNQPYPSGKKLKVRGTNYQFYVP